MLSCMFSGVLDLPGWKVPEWEGRSVNYEKTVNIILQAG